MRSRAALLAIAVCAFGAAFAAAPPAAPQSESVLSALGRSLGGFRVMLVNGLFIQAGESARRGLYEDASGLYRTILDLEPDNTAAAAFLVDAQFESLGYFVDPDERFRWWLALRQDVARTLRLRPDAALLLHRDARLILRAFQGRDAELSARVEEHLGNPELVALERLATAVRLTEVLPGVAGLAHVDDLANVTMRVAARAVLERDAEARTRAIEIGDEALALRAEVLEAIVRLRDPEGDMMDRANRISRRAYLAVGLQVVRRIAEAQAGGDVAAARADLAAYRDLAVDTRALAMLEEAARGL